MGLKPDHPAARRAPRSPFFWIDHKHAQHGVATVKTHLVVTAWTEHSTSPPAILRQLNKNTGNVK
jgi:hypothetical protein